MNTSKNNAARLMMTEGAYFSGAAQRACVDDLGVEQYEIIATMDGHTSDICKSLDGKVFPISDYQVGVTAPPFHVNCCSTTAPHFDENFNLVADGEKTYRIPDNMSYDEWKKTFVDGGDKSGLTNGDNGGIIITNKQRGKKFGKHCSDWKLDPSKTEDCATMEATVTDIYNNPTEIRIGAFNSQKGNVLFYINGHNVVITKQNKEFITVIREGIDDGWVKNARRR